MYLCVRGIDVASFYDFSFIFLNYSDSVVFLNYSDSVVFLNYSDSVVFLNYSDSVVFLNYSDSVVFLFFILPLKKRTNWGIIEKTYNSDAFKN